MATWVRTNTNTPSATDDAPLPFDTTITLDNATAPGDFDPAAVTSVRFQWELSISGLVDDNYTDPNEMELGTVPLAAVDNGNNSEFNNGIVSHDFTDNSPNLAQSAATWAAANAEVGTAASWAIWVKDKGPDGASVTVQNVTITITYTPSSGTNYDETGRTVAITATTSSTDAADFADTVTVAVTATVASSDTHNTASGTDYDETGRTVAITATVTSTDVYSSLSLPFTDDWTGTNGDPWNSTKWPTIGGSSSVSDTVDIQSNEGRMSTGTSSSPGDNAHAIAASVTSIQDSKGLIKITPDTVDNGNQWLYVCLRSSGEALAADSGRPESTIYCRFNVGADNDENNDFVYSRVNGAEGSSLFALNNSGARNVAEPFYFRWELWDSGTDEVNMRYKVWDADATEPVTWREQLDFDDPLTNGSNYGRSGVLQLVLRNFAGGQQADVTVDELTYDAYSTTNDFDETGRTVAITASVSSTDQADYDDALTIPVVATVTSTDAFNTADTVTIPVTATVTSTDQLDMADTVTIPVTATVSSTDQLDMADTVTVTVTATVTSTDQLDMADTVTVAIVATVTSTDVLDIGGTNYDETGRVVAITASTSSTDVWATADTVAIAITAGVSSTDARNMAEAVTVPVVATVSSTDALDMADAVTIPVTATVAISDDASYTDSGVVAIVSTVGSSDTQSGSEALTIAVTSSQVSTDVATFADSLTIAILATVTNTSQLTTPGAYDETGRQIPVTSTFTTTDAFTAVDDVAIAVTATVTSTDAFAASEEPAIAIVATVTSADALNTSEDLTVAITATVTSTETAGFSDQILTTVAFGETGSVWEQAIVTEEVATMPTSFRLKSRARFDIPLPELSAGEQIILINTASWGTHGYLFRTLFTGGTHYLSFAIMDSNAGFHQSWSVPWKPTPEQTYALEVEIVEGGIWTMYVDGEVIGTKPANPSEVLVQAPDTGQWFRVGSDSLNSKRNTQPGNIVDVQVTDLAGTTQYHWWNAWQAPLTLTDTQTYEAEGQTWEAHCNGSDLNRDDQPGPTSDVIATVSSTDVYTGTSNYDETGRVISVTSTVSSSDVASFSDELTVAVTATVSSTDNLSTGANDYDETGRVIAVTSSVTSGDAARFNEQGEAYVTLGPLTSQTQYIIADRINMADADDAHMYQSTGNWVKTGTNDPFRTDLYWEPVDGSYSGMGLRAVQADTTPGSWTHRIGPMVGGSTYDYGVPVTEGEYYLLNWKMRAGQNIGLLWRWAFYDAADQIVSPLYGTGVLDADAGVTYDMLDYAVQTRRQAPVGAVKIKWEAQMRVGTAPGYDDDTAPGDSYEIFDFDVREYASSGTETAIPFVPSSQIVQSLYLEADIALDSYQISQYIGSQYTGGVKPFRMTIPSTVKRTLFGEVTYDDTTLFTVYDGSDTDLVNGQRHTVAMYWDRPNTDLSHYVDGVQTHINLAGSDKDLINNPDTALMVGLNGITPAGDIHRVRLYDGGPDGVLVADFDPRDIPASNQPLENALTWTDKVGLEHEAVMVNGTPSVTRSGNPTVNIIAQVTVTDGLSWEDTALIAITADVTSFDSKGYADTALIDIAAAISSTDLAGFTDDAIISIESAWLITDTGDFIDAITIPIVSDIGTTDAWWIFVPRGDGLGETDDGAPVGTTVGRTTAGTAQRGSSLGRTRDVQSLGRTR